MPLPPFYYRPMVTSEARLAIKNIAKLHTYHMKRLVSTFMLYYNVCTHYRPVKFIEKLGLLNAKKNV
jgi:hypothetical protein